MNILYTKKFVKMFNALPWEIQKIAIQKESVFEKKAFEKSLKTHSLQGKFNGCYSFSINYKYRIVFEFLSSKNDVAFLFIGDHSIYL